MTLATFDYEIEWIVVFLFTLYVNDAAWFGHKTTIQGSEVGYATIMTWVRATGFMFLASFLMFYMAELTIALNAGVNSFASANQGSILGALPFIFYGLFFLDLVMGVVITIYLVLPTERLPKSFQYFGKESQRQREYEAGPD